MSFSREHAAQQQAPDQFAKFRRGRPDAWPQGIEAIYGVKSDGEEAIHSVRFDADSLSEADAKAWLASAHLSDGGFEPAVAARQDGVTETRYDDGRSGAASQLVTSRLVKRFDLSDLERPTKTAEGFLRAQGNLTRSGVFEYQRQDGSVVRELRPPEEVFDAESMRSFALVPLTLNHPPDNLTLATVREHQVGTIGEPQRAGEFLRADMMITDARAIAAVEGGKNQLSNGYTMRLVQRSGTFKDATGQEHRFDAVQTQIRGNHSAIVSRARAGDGAYIRTDSGDLVLREARHDGQWTTAEVDDLPDSSFAYVEPGDKDSAGKTTPRSKRHLPFKDSSGKVDPDHLRDALSRLPQTDIPAADKAKAKDKLEAAAKSNLQEGSKMDEVEVTINGAKIMVPKAVAERMDALEKQAKPLPVADAGLKELKGELEKAQGKIAALEAGASQRQDAPRSDAKATTERLLMLSRASAILEKPIDDLVRMDDAELMRAVVKVAAPQVAIEGKTDDFVRGIFDTVSSQKRVDTAAAINRLVGGARDGDAATRADDDLTKRADEAHKKMIERMANSWDPDWRAKNEPRTQAG